VYRWEHNLNIPRLPVLKKISEYYNIPVEWLVSGNIEDFESVNTPGSHTAECSTEQKLLRLYRSLSDSCKHKAIGYVEGLSHESISNTQRHQVFNAS
jgi:transcriptional regulator with XRE-family HTH domain